MTIKEFKAMVNEIPEELDEQQLRLFEIGGVWETSPVKFVKETERGTKRVTLRHELAY